MYNSECRINLSFAFWILLYFFIITDFSLQQLISIPIPQLHRRILRLQVATMQRKDLCPSMSLIQSWIKEGQLVEFRT